MEFSVVSNVIEYFYRFSFFIVLLYFISKYSAFKRLFYKKDLSRRQELFLIMQLGVISIISFMIFREVGAPLFLPLFFGVYSGFAVGIGTSIILALYLIVVGQPPITIILCFLAGPIGALMGTRIPPGAKKPFYVPLAAGIITLLGFCKNEKPYIPFIELVPTMITDEKMWLQHIVLALLVFVAGCYLLLVLLEMIIAEEDRRLAMQTNNILTLVASALDQIRRGMTVESAKTICQSLQKALDIPGVCIISRDEILYFPGPVPHIYPQSTETFRNIHRRLFDEGLVFEGSHNLIFGECPKECDFTSIFLLPLNDGSRIVASLGFIQSRKQAFSSSEQNLANGLSLIISSELTREKLEEQKIALESAKFKLLQAQINPHFLFNSLNTIAWMTGKDPEKAEELILHLSNFLRQSFDQKGEMVTLRKELEYLKSYLFIEKARFREKLTVEYRVDDEALGASIPPFLIQPLVENAIKHGISKKKDGGTVCIEVQSNPEAVKVAVSDNGAGCTPERLQYVLNPPAVEKEDAPRRGIGVLNVKERVLALFGSSSKFEVESTPGVGTTVSFFISKKGGG
jgi:two-component system sensor histidine kinase LytS